MPDSSLPSSPIYHFLRRHPWSTHSLLSEVFGSAAVIQELLGNFRFYRSMKIQELGDCYAISNEPEATLIGAHRWNLARRHMLPIFRIYKKSKNINIFLDGISPGLQADGEFILPNKPKLGYIRVWVDLGDCEPPALGFIQDPPRKFGSQDFQEDIILTTNQKRAEAIELQVIGAWNVRKLISIQVIGSPVSIKVFLQGKRETDQILNSARTIERFIAKRCGAEKQSTSSGSFNRFGRLSAQLSSLDWLILAKVGNVPLLTSNELSLVIQSDSTSLLSKIAHLIQSGLLRIAENYSEKDRLYLTETSLGLLHLRWNTSQESLRRFQKWPMVINDAGCLTYSINGLEYIGEHNRWTRQYCLSLIDNGIRLTTQKTKITVDLTSTAGARLIYPVFRKAGRDIRTWLTWVSPDAIIQFSYYAVPDGEHLSDNNKMKPLIEKEILLEMDRTRGKLAERLSVYQALYKKMRRTAEKPVLMWVIDGKVNRENDILQLMADMNIPGCTVRLDRLFLPKSAPYWQLTSEVGKNTLSPGTYNYLMPFQSIYRFPGVSGFQPFLGIDILSVSH